jgi:hypothetical protein
MNNQEINWDEQISEIHEFLMNASLPNEFKLSDSEHIVSVPKFIVAHVEYVTNNNGHPAFLPYLKRILRFKEMIEKEQVCVAEESIAAKKRGRPRKHKPN